MALVFSWAYLEEAALLFDTLMLVCCAAMCGFALSGDLFNMFVWLELMGVAAYALTGFEVKEIGPLQGAVNFAIVNGIGGYLIVIGIALAYARTGALNLAQIGVTLTTAGGRGLVVVAMTLVVCGFLCKAAVVPFHLWLADAYAVAPAPVCAVFNAFIALATEARGFQWDAIAKVRVEVLFLNAFVAFLLNVASVFLVRDPPYPLVQLYSCNGSSSTPLTPFSLCDRFITIS